MTASYYTSYETSVALREAGAPQRPDGDRERAWYVSATRGGEPRLINATGAPGESRAFRLDEILEALRQELPAPKHVRLEVGSAIAGRFPGIPNLCAKSPVEAAAACWIAVMRAGRDAK